MAKKIVWSDEALIDIGDIAKYIEKDSPYYAAILVEKIYKKAGSLKTFYRRGRIVPEILDENIREVFINELRMVYKITKEEIIILSVFHGRRDYMKILKGKNN